MYCKIVELSGNLFEAPKNYSLAHCVGADMNMGRGIAMRFKNIFGQIDKLKNQQVLPGGTAILKEKDRFIYYLVTKQLSSQRPTYQNLKSSLIVMRKHIEENDIRNLAIPRIGCGLDRLNWHKVKEMLCEVFCDYEIVITVYIPSSTKTSG